MNKFIHNSKNITRGINCDITAKSRFGKYTKLVVILMSMILAFASISLLAQNWNASATSLGDDEPTVTQSTTITLLQEETFDVNAFDYNRQLEVAGVDTNINPVDYGMSSDAKLESRTTWTEKTTFLFEIINQKLYMYEVYSTSLTESWQEGFFNLTHRSRTTTTLDRVIMSVGTVVNAYHIQFDLYVQVRAGGYTTERMKMFEAFGFDHDQNIYTSGYDVVVDYEFTANRSWAEVNGHGHGATVWVEHLILLTGGGEDDILIGREIFSEA